MRKVWLGMAILPLCTAAETDFTKQVRPVLERACVSCHSAKRPLGKLSVESREALLKGGVKGPAVVPGNPEKSLLYTTVKSGSMPPGRFKLKPGEAEALKLWIAEGANWPEPKGTVVTTVNVGAASVGAPGSAPAKVASPAKAGRKQDDAALVAELHAKIVKGSKEKTAGEMKAYTTVIPGADVSFEMVALAGGEFTMGTPESEKGHKDDESPQHRVKLEPFWMGAREVSWDEYRLFMYAKKDGAEPAVDAVSSPTRPYVEMSFGMGINGFPAISMTQHAANKYAQWLSAKTGQFYRLPTEAEWEYACKTGSDGAHGKGVTEGSLGEYAWYTANSEGKYQKVGTKKPNAWGLYDMLGNVMGWTLDQYLPDAYSEGVGKVAVSPWKKARKPYPHAVRGGSWNDPPGMLRCGARVASDASWKMQDPQLPKSIWYHTDAQWLGFRLVRPLKLPTAKEMEEYWNNGVEEDP